MKDIKKFKSKSVVNCKAGDPLKTISTITFICGIILGVILFINSECEAIVEFLAILLSSLFLCIMGRTIAKMANYQEASYRNINPDYELDNFFKARAKYYPGDKVLAKKGEEWLPVTVVSIDNGGLFGCINESNEVKYFDPANLKAIE